MNKKVFFVNLCKNNQRLLLFLIICLGVFLRMYNIGSESIWYDEAVSIRLSLSPIADILSGKVKDLGNPPLHNICLHYWINLFGKSEMAVRSLSALFGIFSLFLMYKIGKMLFKTKVAFLTTFIYAISPLHIYFSQEARTYSLVTFFCLFSMFFFLKFLRYKNIFYLSGYILTTFLSVYSHYFAFFILLSQNIFLIIYYKKYKNLLSKWVIGQLLISLSYLVIWIPSFLSQIGANENLGRSSETWFMHVIFTPIFYSVGRTLIWKDSSFSKLAIYIFLILVIFGVPFVLGVLQLKKNKKILSLLMLLLIMPIIIPVFISILFFPFYTSRYSIIATPVWYLIVSLGLTSIKKGKIKIFFIVGIVLLSVLSICHYYNANNKFEWRLAANYIENNSLTNDVILFDADIGETAFSYYYQGWQKKIRLYNEPLSSEFRNRIYGFVGNGGMDDITTEINNGNRIWLILSYNFTDGTGDYYERFFNNNYKKIKEQIYKGIKINLYSL